MSPLAYYLKICSLLPALAVSLALNAPSNSHGSLTLTQPSRHRLPSNTSAITENINIKDVLQLDPNTKKNLTTQQVDCDESRFGNPPPASCREVFDLFPRDTASIARNIKRSYGPRGWGTWDVNLPSRLISCEKRPLERDYLLVVVLSLVRLRLLMVKQRMANALSILLR